MPEILELNVKAKQHQRVPVWFVSDDLKMTDEQFDAYLQIKIAELKAIQNHNVVTHYTTETST